MTLRLPAQSASKYGNKHVERDGYTFDSKREAARYAELKLAQEAGEIAQLRVHTRWPLYCPGRTDETGPTLVAYYESDFDYYDVRNGHRFVVEDAKGHRTALYKLKRKWLLRQDGIEIQEV